LVAVRKHTLALLSIFFISLYNSGPLILGMFCIKDQQDIHTLDNAREFSRIGVNAAKTFEQTSKDDARITGQNTSSARVYVETEEERKR
jgi:hypothetical protein